MGQEQGAPARGRIAPARKAHSPIPEDQATNPYLRKTLRIVTGGESLWPSAGDALMALTTSIPSTTRPKAANPWPSWFRLPAKSSAG